MPNWCMTSIGIKADARDEEAVKQLKALREEAQTVLTRSEQGSDQGWIGIFLLDHGKDPEGISCRGFLSDVYEPTVKDNTMYFVIDENDAWSPKLDLWDEMMTLPEYNKLSYVARAEESGCEVFVNTDDSGTIFPELYILDYSVKVPSEGKWMDDYVYFESIADLLSECKKLFGVDGKSFKDLQRKLDAYSESHSDDVELLNVHQFESC